MAARILALALVSIAAVSGALLIVAGTPGPAIAVPVALSVICIPGYAAGRAISPEGWQDAATEMAIAAGLGLTITILGGILLNVLGIGIFPGSVLGLAVIATALASVLAVARRRHALRQHRLVAEPPVASAEVPDRASGLLRLSSGSIALLLLALVFTAASIRIARVALAEQPHAGFTQLSIIPGPQPDSATVEIVNDEGSAQSYRLDVTRGNKRLDSRSVQLEGGDSTSLTFELPPPGVGPVQVNLYRADDPKRVYRWVTYWPQQ